MAAVDTSLNQMRQMKDFILNEAKDRAEEITSKALQEFTVEKMKIMNETKEKIRGDYLRKTKQMETQNAIARSTAVNKSRIEKIKSRQDVLTKVKEDSKAELVKELKSEAKSKEFLKKLMVQGMLMLLEDEVKVRCRACDDAAVKAALAGAMDEYASIIKRETGSGKQCKLTLDTENKLLPPPTSDPNTPSCLGGVVLVCQKDSITIDNTIDSRLGLVMDQAKPNLRKLLFSS